MDIDRAIDFEYLKLTVALVLLLIIVFMLTSRFRTYPKQITQTAANTGFAAGASGTGFSSGTTSTMSGTSGTSGTSETKTENFAPYASILSPNMFRSDPSHDAGKEDKPPSGNYTEHFGTREYHSYPTRGIDSEFAMLSGLTSEFEDESHHYDTDPNRYI